MKEDHQLVAAKDVPQSVSPFGFRSRGRRGQQQSAVLQSRERQTLCTNVDSTSEPPGGRISESRNRGVLFLCDVARRRCVLAALAGWSSESNIRASLAFVRTHAASGGRAGCCWDGMTLFQRWDNGVVNRSHQGRLPK